MPFIGNLVAISPVNGLRSNSQKLMAAILKVGLGLNFIIIYCSCHQKLIQAIFDAFYWKSRGHINSKRVKAK